MDDTGSKTGLVRCIYTSRAVQEFTQDDITDLLRVARRMNSALGVTGMLLFDRCAFFQVLKGPPETVEALYETISADARHNRVTKIIQEPIDHRDFGEWTMGYSGASGKDLARINGLNDFFIGGSCLSDIDAGRAKTLLRAFREGRWRGTID